MATLIKNYPANVVVDQNGTSTTILKRNLDKNTTNTRQANEVRIDYFKPNDTQISSITIDVTEVTKPDGLDTPNALKEHLDHIFSDSLQTTFREDSVIVGDGVGGTKTIPDFNYKGTTQALELPYIELTGEHYWQFSIPGQAWYASTTNAASKHESETATNNRDLKGWSFAKNSDQTIEFTLHMPRDWKPSTVRMYVIWFGKSSGSNGESAVFELSVSHSAKGESLDQPFRLSSGNKEFQVNNIEDQEEHYLDIDLSDVGKNELITFRLQRVGTNSSDNLADGAVVLETSVVYQQDGKMIRSL